MRQIIIILLLVLTSCCEQDTKKAISEEGKLQNWMMQHDGPFTIYKASVGVNVYRYTIFDVYDHLYITDTVTFELPERMMRK